MQDPMSELQRLLASVNEAATLHEIDQLRRTLVDQKYAIEDLHRVWDDLEQARMGLIHRLVPIVPQSLPPESANYYMDQGAHWDEHVERGPMPRFMERVRRVA